MSVYEQGTNWQTGWQQAPDGSTGVSPAYYDRAFHEQGGFDSKVNGYAWWGNADEKKFHETYGPQYGGGYGTGLWWDPKTSTDKAPIGDQVVSFLSAYGIWIGGAIASIFGIYYVRNYFHK